MEFDAVLLSRLQFAFTIAFHILFPTLTIGLGAFLVLIEGLWLKTGDRIYELLYKFWTKVFALTFGMGVVTGVVLSYEVGTNWSRFADVTGNVLGPLFIYEVLSAFFLEAGFVGIMLFGWNRVGPRMHFFATAMVSFGTLVSAFWIIAANSFMQTPAGLRIIEGGRLFVDSWFDVVFNPSLPTRFPHMVLASYVTAMFVVAGISALHLLMDRPPQSGAPQPIRSPSRRWPSSSRCRFRRRCQRAGRRKASAGQDRRVRRALGDDGRRAAAAVCLARPGRRDQPSRNRHTQAREPHPDAQPRRRGARPQGVRPAGPAARLHRLLGFPRDGRHRGADARVGWLEPAVVVAKGRLHESGLLLTVHVAMIPLGFVADAGRLDRGRSRAPALGRLRRPAHIDAASPASGRFGGDVARPVLRRLQCAARRLRLFPHPARLARPRRPGRAAVRAEPTIAKRAMMPAE